MDIQTLQQIERETCTSSNKYTDRDAAGKLIAQFEKDANGKWQDVTGIRQAEEHYIEIARRAGIPERQIQQAISEARERRERLNKQNHTT